jgi:hypothetical protein
MGEVIKADYGLNFAEKTHTSFSGKNKTCTEFSTLEAAACKHSIYCVLKQNCQA